VTAWEEIPAVPTEAFQHAVLTTAPATRVFRTSGTTRGRRGEHHVPDLGPYAAAWAEPFRRHVLPDRERMAVVSLLPAEEDFPDSSLAYMGELIGERFATTVDRFHGADGIDAAGAVDRLDSARVRDEPVLVLATAFAALEVLDHLAVRGLVSGVPEGSRVMDTGGFKGRSREMSREDLLVRYEQLLNIPAHSVVGEYGMTELSSQFYEGHLARGEGSGDRSLAGPPWTRVRILDPLTLRPVSPGDPGLIAVFDLANAWTVCSILTGDLGRATDTGFHVLGRAAGAALRGCSLLTEEILDRA
jgi:hypothetical protein